MKINIDYDSSKAKCSMTTLFGHPDVFVDFNNTDELSQVVAMNAFKCIIDSWIKIKEKK